MNQLLQVGAIALERRGNSIKLNSMMDICDWIYKNRSKSHIW